MELERRGVHVGETSSPWFCVAWLGGKGQKRGLTRVFYLKVCGPVVVFGFKDLDFGFIKCNKGRFDLKCIKPKD